jgi:adenylate kinase
VGEVFEIIRCFLPGMSYVRMRIVSECRVLVEEHLFGGVIRVPKGYAPLTPKGITVRLESTSIVVLSRSDDGQGSWLFEYSM